MHNVHIVYGCWMGIKVSSSLLRIDEEEGSPDRFNCFFTRREDIAKQDHYIGLVVYGGAHHKLGGGSRA